MESLEQITLKNVLKEIYPIVTHGHLSQGGYPSAFAAYKVIIHQKESIHSCLHGRLQLPCLIYLHITEISMYCTYTSTQ